MRERFLYEKDRERIEGYQKRIDGLLKKEDDIIVELSDEALSAADLDMIAIGIRRQQAMAASLLATIREDMRDLSGGELSTAAVYEQTVSGIAERLSGLLQAAEDAAVGLKTAGAAGAAAAFMERLRSFAEGIRGEK